MVKAAECQLPCPLTCLLEKFEDGGISIIADIIKINKKG
jgi:hypothetical protein